MPKLALFILLASAALLELVESGGHEHGHRHVIIHVPYKIKTIKHTHTITKHIHHKDGGDKYEVLGYTVGHPMDLGGHGGGGHDFGGHDWSGGGGDGGGGHDWSGGGISEGFKGGYEGSFDGGHGGGYEAAGGHSELGGHEYSGGHEFSGGYGGHEEYGGH